jgi:hypothetical protein
MIVMKINKEIQPVSYMFYLTFLHLTLKIVIESCCSVLNVLHVLSFLSVFSLTKNEYGNQDLIGLSLTMRIDKYSSDPNSFRS